MILIWTANIKLCSVYSESEPNRRYRFSTNSLYLSGPHKNRKVCRSNLHRGLRLFLSALDG